ncbi:rhomboid family intramembrane serine protease [bacterium]|nr:rhomboid family intramembrane serine protease [bacterium]MBU1652396.1 rhomboid family intramembrane serine protease [bacterium]MBU1881279.1 rhomboid family intramembrane serine protease [bacterium]
MIPIKDENPGRTFPLVTLSIIVANISVFLYQLTLPHGLQNDFVMTFGLVPAALTGGADLAGSSFPPILTLFTSQFLHGGIFHLLGNMLYLWIFGNNIEDVLGRFRFLLFYLLCGVLAAIAHLILNTESIIPMVGASGAIAGVLGAYLMTFPGARVVVLVFLFIFITTIRVQTFWVLGLWFLMQLLYAGSSATGAVTNVAYMAHVGGFLAGIWLMRKFRPRVKWKVIK